MNSFKIMIVKCDARSKIAPHMQEIFTKYGCNIKVRLGLHEAGDACSNQGLILLQLTNDEKESKAFLDELNGLDGVTAKLVDI
jgi:hypothetical protein